MINTKEFMTKTEYIDRKDVSPREDVYLIGIDIGYSAVKCISENTAAVFPSFAIPDNKMGTFGDLGSEFIRYRNLVTNECWLVGKIAAYVSVFARLNRLFYKRMTAHKNDTFPHVRMP